MEGRLTLGVAGCVHRLALVIAQCLLVWHLTVITVLSADPYPVFKELYQPENNVIKLQNMLLDPNTGALYVGSVNRLYKLSTELQVEDMVETGPRQDNQACLAPPFPCDHPRETTNNVNKLLVLDNDRLIICGSIYQGSCLIRNLTNLGLLGNDSYEEIAPNTADGMSVAFVAPGPREANVLYVASSHANWIDRAVPTLSSRVLPTENTGGDLFNLLEDKDNFYKWEKKIPTDLLTAFNIYYLYGFTDTTFSYFVAVQPQVSTENQPEQPYYTKIAQVCQDDVSYYSYIELPLACKKGETSYNVAQSAYVTTVGSDLAAQSGYLIGEKVLFVTFSESLENKRDPTRSSAVCMYLVKKINEQFNDRRKECALGQTVTTEIPWLRSPPCAPENSPANELVKTINNEGTAYCHKQDFIQPLGGNTPITAQAIYTVNSVLGAIAATGHLEETVIFLGDDRGHLQKLKVVSPTEAVLYAEDAKLNQERPVVRNGVIFSPDKNYIYFMTEKKIHKIPVEDCSAYTTCDTCLEGQMGVGDPYCGWCSLQKNCTRRSQTECTGSEDQSNLRWLGQPAQCIAILSVEPPNTPSNKTQELTLTTRGLPQLDPASSHTYQCKFKSTSQDLPLQSATVDPANPSLVGCLTPPSNKLPPIPEGFLKVNLSILATETGLDIVTTEFDFYICSAFSSCTECVGYEYRCDWCIFENECVGNSAACDPSGIITKQEGVSNGELSCPRIVKANDEEILIPAGVSTGFNVSTKNLPTPKSENTGYQCILDIEGRMEAVAATMIDESSLECQPRIYLYDTDVNDLQVGLTVKWNNDFKIDNPDDLLVNLYKCEVKRPTCGDCLGSLAKYQCGWCNTGNSAMDDCSMREGCRQDWLRGDALCPDAIITEFFPRSGYTKGGTNLTIKGTNLGQKVEDIRRITVADVECIVTETGYKVAKQVTCTTQRSDAGMKQGQIKIVIGGANSTNTVTAESDDIFNYVIPKLTLVSPALGPMSGGTEIRISGRYLDAGKEVIIVVGGEDCKLIKNDRTSDSLVCTTPPGPIGKASIAAQYDSEALDTTELEFEYKKDPVIMELNRYKSIVSGGLDVRVEGTNLDVIQNPKLQFNIKGETLKSDCKSATSTHMICTTPNFSPYTRPYSTLEVLRNHYGFILDGVKNFTSLGLLEVFQTFEVVSDPVFRPFDAPNNIQQLQHDQTNILEIKGENLTLAYKEGDVKVTVGDESCKDVTLTAVELTCDPPDERPNNGGGGKFPRVVVYYGNRNYTIGQLEYVGEDFLIYILIGAGSFIILIIIVFILCFFYRKAFANDTIVKQLEAARDQLEMQVAKECKETFAELQTDMTIITDELEAIPYREYHMYCIRTLFPDQPNHNVLKELALAGASKTHIEKGLVQFEQLVNNKQFLLTFIRTLEAQKTFTQKDKSNVASLIMVALQGKMDYSTSILKILLADLIERHVEKDRARLLMRSANEWVNRYYKFAEYQSDTKRLKGCLEFPWNESVAEKMVSNWLSFLLYNFIREKAGEPLFKLFYAIKQQMEKGPIDAITGEARYGLSEVKVIRQQINYNVMTIYAIGLDKDVDPAPVKVLDYDTISQVKEKILDALYKTVPYSHRPPKEELDLEWRGEEKRILLQDDDSKTEGEWRRLKMLCNYPEIRDGASIALVPKQGFTMSMYSNSKYMTLPSASSPNRSVTTPMLPADTDSNGTRLWHLVKPSDSDYHKPGFKVDKMMAEIYLPRLLTTKGVLQTFNDELFEMIFSVNHRGDTLPICIKYLFDMLDDQAALHNIQNQDVVHSWKSNSLPLRFWVNLIKNPDIIFDIYKSETVDACLSIIGQTLMDACSVSDHPLTKDSSSSRLLYAKDIPKYKKWVASYFEDIRKMPAISDQDMSAMLAEHSHTHQYDFHTNTALNELYFFYAITYKKQIIEELEENEFNALADKFSKLCDQLNNTL